MTISITDYVSVRERAAAMNCPVPQGLALIPSNFSSAADSSEFLQQSEAATVRALFRNNHIPLENLLSGPGTSKYIQNNGFEWVSPIIFIGSSLLSENPNLVSLALNVLSSYITDFFKGVPGDNKVKIEFIVEQNKDYTCKTLRYEGDISGIPLLEENILRIHNE